MTGRRQTVVLIGAGGVAFTQVLMADVARLVRRMVDLLRAQARFLEPPGRGRA
jgi:hypothetical protein